MSFHRVYQELSIDSVDYRIAEHPAAPGMPYGQEGRAATVYQLLTSEGTKRALKVFKPRHRVPALVGQARRIKPLADLPGLRVCRRMVLSARRHKDLLCQYPDLTYAVLMPWIEGPTWMQIMCEERAISPEQCLDLAQSLAEVLAAMEEQGLAHCDLSGPNVMIPALASSGSSGHRSSIELVDVEQLYGSELKRPEMLPSGLEGYAHKTASDGLWGAKADRFAGAVLLAEMLGWCDERVREAAWGESYFATQEMQQESERFQILVEVLQEQLGTGVVTLFERTWRSETLSDCPTFGEWLVALPGKASSGAGSGAGKGVSLESEETAAKPDSGVQHLLDLARTFEEQGELDSALKTYHIARAAAPPEGSLAQELELVVRDLEDELGSRESTELAQLFDDGLAAFQRGEWTKARELLGELERREPGYERSGRKVRELLAEAEKQRKVRELLAEAEKQDEDGPTQPIPVWGWAIGGVAVLGFLIGFVLLAFGGGAAPTPAITKTPAATPGPEPVPGSLPADASLHDTWIRPVDEMVMVYVPGGTFEMGSTEGDDDERPVHDVTLDGFWLDQTEVTNAQYALCVADGDCGASGYADDVAFNGSNYPVVGVSWHDATAYCEWAGAQLPTEAKWEYAARGPEGRIFPWGDAFDSQRLNFCDTSCSPEAAEYNDGYDDGYERTAPVGSFPEGASWCDALDMAGNVVEWVADWYDEDYYDRSPSENPTGPSSGDDRVLRGGSWHHYPSYVRAATRIINNPAHRYNIFGFRCARDSD